MPAYNKQPPLKLLSAVAVWEIFKFRAEESIVYFTYFGLWRSRSMFPYREGVGLVDDSLEEKVEGLNLSMVVSVSVM